ncbi:MAG TPA: hypothetical protein VGW10_09715, partial [Solirubrobacteraceae bacterium]|nr:hypothetical protein [Solirubrobacteraceae bacterium]
ALVLTTLAVAAPAAAAPRAVTIDAVRDRVAAAPLRLDVTATIPLSGRAAPGSIVEVYATCSLRLCLQSAEVNRRGRWRTKLHVVVPPRRTTVFVRARYALGEETTREVRLTSPPPVTGRPELALIGDSLAQGTAPYLPELLPGWRVTIDALRGRPLLTGMAINDTVRKPKTRPYALAFSLFTNDDPSRADELATWARQSLDGLPPGSCAIWATIARPPVRGVSYARANRVLEAVAAEPHENGRRVVIVPWARAVRARPDWLRDDRVHATEEGYRARARLYAAAAESCGGGR